jgi:hypothetical protein
MTNFFALLISFFAAKLAELCERTAGAKPCETLYSGCFIILVNPMLQAYSTLSRITSLRMGRLPV